MWSDITLIVLSIGLGGERDEAKSGAEASVPGSMAISMFMSMNLAKLNLLRKLPSPSVPSEARHLRFFKPLHCAPIEQVQDEVDVGILCEPCNGKGWLLCDFCEGQKTNVKSKSNRIYRRCPSCKAVGYLLCSNCKVFKCVTFPNYNDGDDLSF